MLVRSYLTVLTLVTAVTARVRRDDRGALTTEQAIITAGLIGLAMLVIAAITAAVNNKLPLIR